MSESIIIKWLVNKGLSYSSSLIMKSLEIEKQQVIIDSLNLINEKVNILIKAPYKEAIYFLKENNLEKCAEKLVESISKDELNIHSRLLYAKILCYKGLYNLALDIYWDCCESFGTANPILPDFIKELHYANINKVKLAYLIPNLSINLHFGNYEDKKFPIEIYCSIGGIVSVWIKNKNILENLFGLSSYREVVFHKWDSVSKEMEYKYDSSPSASSAPEIAKYKTPSKTPVFCVTNKFAVVENENNKYTVLRIHNGSVLDDNLSKEFIEGLFFKTSRNSTNSFSYDFDTNFEKYSSIEKMYKDVGFNYLDKKITFNYRKKPESAGKGGWYTWIYSGYIRIK